LTAMPCYGHKTRRQFRRCLRILLEPDPAIERFMLEQQLVDPMPLSSSPWAQHGTDNGLPARAEHHMMSPNLATLLCE
jgi:hypothetical protein